MMNKEGCVESVSLKSGIERKERIDGERMREYKTFAVAFSYPNTEFFQFFPNLLAERPDLLSEYDRLFRAKEIWLYGAEYLAKNEFQRVNYLSDIMGFYRAFGLETDKVRPDYLPSELEFMHYLIHKRLYALESLKAKDAKEKAFICLDAQKKFFNQHLYPAAKEITRAIISQAGGGFYKEVSKQALTFLAKEEKFLGRKK